ncbi:complex I intermediate-associated protein 30, mitochondrial [Sitophilus oryzae]|uniref:Complex I intermediate-associated protein 30, mitochondrial n=1 Tax=Sitophilus oryzae TaxID=7048 RepID=A0A6J2YPI1_SITOR|nr:complex I intermediate-associated protein 30, mitochondrial [Sitophilus oryzae]
MTRFIRNFLSTSSLLFNSNKRCISTTTKVCTFFERSEKGGYESNRPLPPFKERMRMGLAELKKEVALWSEELKEKFKDDPILLYRRGEVDVVYKFQNEDSLNKWIVTSDKDHNEGFSSSSLELTNHGKALFSGELVLRVPKDGRVKRAGYCNIKTVKPRKSFKRETYLDWSNYNMLVMKVRGDGRTYLLNVHTKGYFDVTWNDMFNYPLFTRGGPYWQIVKIPFSKFFLSSKGRIQDNQGWIPLDKVSSFGITAVERYAGEFSLEIDYIGLEYDPSHTEEFAYEMYKLPSGIANT